MKFILRYIYKKIKSVLRGHGIGKIKFVRKLHEGFLKSITPEFVFIGGHKIYIDKNDSMRLSMGENHEEFETKLIKQEIKKGYTVLDIGGHIGYYTLMFSHLVGNTGKVYVFEPDSKVFNILKKNVEVNNYANVILENKAVGNKTGKIKFYLSDVGRATDNRIYDIGKNRKSVTVDSVKLDKYFNKKQKIDFIKLDIEGAEGIALQGMTKLLKKNKNLKILLEFMPSGLKYHGINPENYCKNFMKQGFDMYMIRNDGLEKIKEKDISKLCNDYDGKNEVTNLFLKRV